MIYMTGKKLKPGPLEQSVNCWRCVLSDYRNCNKCYSTSQSTKTAPFKHVKPSRDSNDMNGRAREVLAPNMPNAADPEPSGSTTGNDVSRRAVLQASFQLQLHRFLAANNSHDFASHVDSDSHLA